jgi:hypothetical protein
MKKRLILSLAIALLMIGTLALPAIAATAPPVTASVHVNSTISITIIDAPTDGIHFGNLDPGTTDNPDLDASDTTPSIIVENSGNEPADVQISGTDFGTGFDVTNAKYSLTYAGAKVAMSTSNATVQSLAAGANVTIWHWLDVPSGVAAGDYSSTFSYQTVAP